MWVRLITASHTPVLCVLPQVVGVGLSSVIQEKEAEVEKERANRSERVVQMTCIHNSVMLKAVAVGKRVTKKAPPLTIFKLNTVELLDLMNCCNTCLTFLSAR